MTDLPPMLFSLDGDTPRTRKTDPETSHAAADGSDLHGSQNAVMVVLKVAELPMTDAEICAAVYAFALMHNYPRYSPARLRTARKELQLAGKVRLVDGDGVSEFGRPSQRWAVA